MARQKGQKGGHTTLLQRQFMVEWLKKPADFNVIVDKANDDHSAGWTSYFKVFRKIRERLGA
ncbi:hypothetical protein GN958_ATG12133 [Phytophthora infestans]|uniref:Uncharacterized protein n=1 Tax=Phytophthora infestans TaxID=4787 RepID=A0A8S9UFA0_PHYIN|nr:hypothetical protein GN958_ATG12654 [Phytophthora infestans]KAF4138697.1 hypothetical protein GN958_ATG12133 [Phytophthora infestans]